MAPRVTLITGCSSGIGLSTAVMLAQDSTKGGYIVYATMRNLAKKGDLEAAAGSTLNKNLFILELDVTKHDTIVQAVKTITDKHGRFDILVNNAGFGSVSYVELITIDQVRQMFETNFFGAVRMTQEVIPIMKKQRSGRIVSVSSGVGTFGIPFVEMYCASKYALEGFSESIAASLRPFNIWVSTVQPGPVQTKFAENNAPNNQPGFDQMKNEKADEFSRQAMTKFLTSTMSRPEFAENQTGDDIARVIQDALEADKPHFQYPTSKCRAVHAATKYVDITNDTSVNYFAAACTPDS